MEEFTEEHAKKLLSKEWLAKSDTELSKPYLMKYGYSSSDTSCFMMITDTKSVWGEALNSTQLARRWRKCNPDSPQQHNNDTAEEIWREQILDLLLKIHTIGAITDASFESVQTNYSDSAFEIECGTFKWRWETCFLGHTRSADIISQHLIFPLISLSHLTFSSAEAVGEVAESEVEKSIDKLARTSRRTVDVHIKNAMSKPRLATSIRRMTAMFNFVSDLPPVISTAEKADLQIEYSLSEEVDGPASKSLAIPSVEPSREPLPVPKIASPSQSKHTPAVTANASGSETESESEVDAPSAVQPGTKQPSAGPSSTPPDIAKSNNNYQESKPASRAKIVQSSDSDESPHRPAKKAKSKALSSSDDESGQSTKRSVSVKSGTTSNSRKPGVRQPVKRGGKRF
ncbi:hypothetical protein BJ165DRAFT_1526130 [Panaeolus papilionaceus]|nr:hypothetical protein BJ165DRAFT_1526130 [Panaeolus papilionaceus]